jgi:hypothetical protein
VEIARHKDDPDHPEVAEARAKLRYVTEILAAARRKARQAADAEVTGSLAGADPPLTAEQADQLYVLLHGEG